LNIHRCKDLAIFLSLEETIVSTIFVLLGIWRRLIFKLEFKQGFDRCWRELDNLDYCHLALDLEVYEIIVEAPLTDDFRELSVTPARILSYF
jgi:hypothetical protein